MKKQLAFVLGGGGARGALQVGALRALLEAGFSPELLVGTSIGAANAAFLALHGVNVEGVEALVGAWREAAASDLLPSNYLWLTVRTLFNRRIGDITHRLQDLCLHQGITPDLCFGDIHGVRLVLVSANLNAGRPVLYGLDPGQSVLEGILASAALPPWVTPMRREGRLLMDGGVVSNLPIEPALAAGADEIIALDLSDPRDSFQENHDFGSFLGKVVYTVNQRQAELELALASACNVPVRHLKLRGPLTLPLWDFRRTQELIDCGYEFTRAEIQRWQAVRRPGWAARLQHFIRRSS